MDGITVIGGVILAFLACAAIIGWYEMRHAMDVPEEHGEI